MVDLLNIYIWSNAHTQNKKTYKPKITIKNDNVDKDEAIDQNQFIEELEVNLDGAAESSMSNDNDNDSHSPTRKVLTLV